MSDILISIITPSFNQGQYIERTIKSVCDQNIEQMEFLVFDGGSTDSTLHILQKYETQLRWVSEPDDGQTHAVNKGFKQARGKYIGWLNSDDIFYPGALNFVIDYFEKNPQIDVIYGKANHIDESDQIIEPYYSEPWNFERLKEVCFICQPATFFRRTILDKVGLLNQDLNYCMDYEFWLRLAKNGVNFTYVDYVLAGSRLHRDTKTLSARFLVHKEINDMLKKCLGKVPDRWLSNYAHMKLEEKRKIKNTNKHFAKWVALEALLASLKWNKTISLSLLKMLLKWI